jgi:hypothetical protein
MSRHWSWVCALVAVVIVARDFLPVARQFGRDHERATRTTDRQAG